jgi:hypothetical protein
MPADGGEIIELAGLLMPADPSLVEEVRLAIVSADEYVGRFQERLRDRGIKEPRSDLQWIALVDGLENRGRLRELGKKEAAEDIAWKIDNDLLPDRPVQPDRWAFLAEELDLWEAVPWQSLPVIAAHLVKEGLAVVTLDMDSDSYPMMVLPADQVGECQRLAELAGYSITDWCDPPAAGSGCTVSSIASGREWGSS